MPIHDQSYRRYRGERTPRGRAWVVITKTGVRTLLARRGLLALLVLAWLPFFARALQIYAVATLPQAAAILPLTVETFRDFIGNGLQRIFVFFITVYVGAGLIANDRRANALQIYLSKPMTRAEYVFGKLAILVTFLLFVTWVPAVLLLLVQVLLAGSVTFIKNNVYVLPAITLFSFIYVGMVSAVMLALSSLSSSSRYVAVLYATLIFFSQALYGVLRLATGGTSLSWVSFAFNLDQIGDAIFRLPPRSETPWIVSLVMIVALVAASGVVLERRIRPVEVVG